MDDILTNRSGGWKVLSDIVLQFNKYKDGVELMKILTGVLYDRSKLFTDSAEKYDNGKVSPPKEAERAFTIDVNGLLNIFFLRWVGTLYT